MTDTKRTQILDVDIFTDLYVAGLAALAQRGDINLPAVMSDIHDGAAHKFASNIVKCVNMHDEFVETLKFIADSNMTNPQDFKQVARETLKKAGAL